MPVVSFGLQGQLSPLKRRQVIITSTSARECLLIFYNSSNGRLLPLFSRHPKF
jgi:hypothetical protein